jgi:hypothetical protein
MKTMGQSNLKLLGGQAFLSQGPCDLDLWPGDLKINRDHLLIMTNVHWADKKKTTDIRTAGQSDGRTDELIPVYPPYNFVVRGYN